MLANYSFRISAALMNRVRGREGGWERRRMRGREGRREEGKGGRMRGRIRWEEDDREGG